jgi:uncharacterized UBP type Zn finger protein
VYKLNFKEMEIAEINGKKVIVKGVGKMYYESGFPISMSVEKAKTMGCEVSVLHVADELLKNGMSPKTVVSRIKEDFVDGGLTIPMEHIEKFCNSSYEDQREMIFQSVFGFPTSDTESIKKIIESNALKIFTFG